MISPRPNLNIRLLLCIVSLIMLAYGSASAGTIVVKPGQFDHFTLQIPEKMIAGENFVIKAFVYDANNNLITNFSEYGKEFRVEVSGAATVHPTVLNGKSFSGGAANILVNSRKSERITFSIKESGGSVPVITRELLVAPNKLDHFVLLSPPAVTAGTVFDLKIIAKDMFENTVGDLDIGRNIKITSTGTSSMKRTGSSTIDFRNGTGAASFVAEKAGELVIDVQEITSGSRGKTQDIKINPAALTVFKMQAPRKVIAGEAFEVMIAAYDIFGNLVTNYAAVGAGVNLATTGNAKVEPSFISPADFKNGQALIKTVYEKAEEIQVIARENNRNQEGKTDVIVVTNSSPDHFVVITPETALSGQRFKIKIEAYDRFNNIVSNFSLIGSDVELTTSGTGSINPARITSSDFINGVSIVDVLYDKAESFLISARMMGEKPTGRITTQDRDVEKEIAKIERRKEEKAAEPELMPAGETDIGKKEKESVPEKRPEPKPAVIPEKAEIKKEAKKPEKAVKTAKKEAPVVRPAEKKPAEDSVGKKPAAAPVPPSEKKPVKAPPAAKPEVPVEKSVAAKEPVTEKDRVDVYKISKVTIIEAKDKAMLVVNITSPNGRLDYSDEIESKYGKEWLKLILRPAINSTEKLFKFSSAFIGEVRIEEDKAIQNTLSVFIELLPSNVTYDIARVKNTLIVTLANP